MQQNNQLNTFENYQEYNTIENKQNLNIFENHQQFNTFENQQNLNRFENQQQSNLLNSPIVYQNNFKKNTFLNGGILNFDKNKKPPGIFN